MTTHPFLAFPLVTSMNVKTLPSLARPMTRHSLDVSGSGVDRHQTMRIVPASRPS